MPRRISCQPPSAQDKKNTKAQRFPHRCGGVSRRKERVSMHPSVVSAFPAKELITKAVRSSCSPGNRQSIWSENAGRGKSKKGERRGDGCQESENVSCRKLQKRYSWRPTIGNETGARHVEAPSDLR